MHTLGFSFKPWTEADAIADGPAIMRYLRETVAEYGLEAKIRFRHRVVSAAWSSAEALWTLQVLCGEAEEPSTLQCRFLFMGTGYYDYEHPYDPELPDIEAFEGRLMHPQFWDEDYDYGGQRVVVIGSGATAVTLVPALVERAAHVTMLQRTPTYMGVRPRADAVADRLRRWLPERLAYGLTRWKNVLLGRYFYDLCRRRPERVKRMLLDRVRAALGNEAAVARHFTPPYDPWDQRLCLVPDGDLFEAIKAGRAAVVTDTIAGFTATGIALRSGRKLEADLIVTATGLELKALGGVALSVDGETVQVPETFAYKGMMLSGVPNLVMAFGYTNASWTLKADLTAAHFCRLLNSMRRHGHSRVVPRLPPEGVTATPFLDLKSGYVRRGNKRFPRQGSARPWKLYQNYFMDLALLRFAPLRDPALAFSSPETDAPEAALPRKRAA